MYHGNTPSTRVIVLVTIEKREFLVRIPPPQSGEVGPKGETIKVKAAGAALYSAKREGAIRAL
jgi:hypothetical protein